MTLVIITLRHFFDLLTNSVSVSAEALACVTGVVTDITDRAVLTSHPHSRHKHHPHSLFTITIMMNVREKTTAGFTITYKGT